MWASLLQSWKLSSKKEASIECKDARENEREKGWANKKEQERSSQIERIIEREYIRSCIIRIGLIVRFWQRKWWITFYFLW